MIDFAGMRCYRIFFLEGRFSARSTPRLSYRWIINLGNSKTINRKLYCILIVQARQLNGLESKDWRSDLDVI